MFGTILNICIQDGTVLVPNQSAQLTHPLFLYVLLRVDGSLLPDIRYWSHSVRSLILVNEQILLHLQVFQSNFKSRTMPRTLNYMIFTFTVMQLP
jgi:hypothetical protein